MGDRVPLVLMKFSSSFITSLLLSMKDGDGALVGVGGSASTGVCTRRMLSISCCFCSSVKPPGVRSSLIPGKGVVRIGIMKVGDFGRDVPSIMALISLSSSRLVLDTASFSVGDVGDRGGGKGAGRFLRESVDPGDRVP